MKKLFVYAQSFTKIKTFDAACSIKTKKCLVKTYFGAPKNVFLRRPRKISFPTKICVWTKKIRMYAQNFCLEFIDILKYGFWLVEVSTTVCQNRFPKSDTHFKITITKSSQRSKSFSTGVPKVCPTPPNWSSLWGCTTLVRCFFCASHTGTPKRPPQTQFSQY